MADEQQRLSINPIVQDSVMHNTRTLTNIRSLTSSLTGLCAGTLGLESLSGFLFYLFTSLLVSALIWSLPAARKPERYFYRPVSEVWWGDLGGGLMGFVLTWCVVYNLVGA